MHRDAAALAETEFDLLVVGAGILGSFIAWDAALRGLTVAVVDRGDFGGATSANSMGILHGGLRYLQQANLARARRSLRDRAAWIRTAPHLVRPLPVLVPCTSRWLAAGFRAAAKLTVRLERDLRATIPQSRQLPASRILSPHEATTLVPELTGCTSAGALLFHDAQLTRPERAIIEIVSAAVVAGAVAANYVEVRRAWREHGAWKGVVAQESSTGTEIAIRTRQVVIAAGPSSPGLTAQLLGRRGLLSLHHTWSLNLAFERRPPQVAFALDASPRRLFLVPWRGLTVVGTAHYEDRPPDRVAATEQDVQRFLSDVNAAWPGRPFDASEVRASQAGLIALARSSRGRLHFQESPIIVDHREHGTPEVVTAITEKLTTARSAAERVVDIVSRRLGHSARCRTASTPLPGAHIDDRVDLVARAAQVLGDGSQAIAETLVDTYGACWEGPLRHRVGDGAQVVHGTTQKSLLHIQFLHGVLEEMAQTPDDLLFRRTDLGPRGRANDDARRLATSVLSSVRGSDMPSL